MEDFELLTEEQIEHLFDDGSQEEPENNEDSKQKEQSEETTEVDVDNLFTEPESVGSGNENTEEKEDDTTSAKESTSPNNFYSSIANALVEDGVTPDLDVTKVKDAESLSDAIKDYIHGRLDETQKRIDEALNNGVAPSEINFYENTIKSLESIKEDYIEEENNEEFRKKLIYQDLINKGFSKEDAQEELQEILDNGTDIKKAKKALVNMKDFYNRKYKEVLSDAKEAAAEEEKRQKEKVAQLKKDLLESKSVFDLDLTKEDRQKAYDAITKPIWKDPETGNYYTAIQKYEKDNKEEFMKKLAVIYVKTNGFESLDSLIKGKVNKESKKAFKDLENKINNTRRTSDGNLMFAGDPDDSESIFKGYSLDI